jgi:GrpB-like predicted nucleotidyltransferase (UPF0157 family)
MPPSTVVLAPHDPAWASQAAHHAASLQAAASGSLKVVHHIGSTAVEWIAAKPVIDLLGVAVGLTELDRARSRIEALGYVWKGEYGLVGRRYCRLHDPVSGEPRVHLHCYEESDPAVGRHLAFRDLLRSSSLLAAKYEVEKRRCAELHPADGGAYTECKGLWIRRIEASIRSVRP